MAHTLTIVGWETSSYYKVPEVNGVEKVNSDSPITLKNGDVIKVPTDRASVTINGTSYVGQATTLDLSNQDIALAASGPEKTLENYNYIIINYTENEGSTNKVTIDLTTLSGWNDVTSGEHQISVVAKATGYRDSEKSTPITFTKQGGSSVSKN